MKKNINKFTAFAAAGTIFLSSFPCIEFEQNSAYIYAADLDAADMEEWTSGFTGSENAKDYLISTAENGVVMQNTKSNNGKFSDSEDTFLYYASEINKDADFELSATVQIDECNTNSDASNQNQSSVGIGIIDNLYHKTDDIKYTNGIYLGTWAKSKTDNFAFYSMIRNNSETKTIGEKPLSETFSNSGTNLGEFKLSLKKTGNIYTFKCGDLTEVIEAELFSDSIFPCLYAARNVKVTFKDVKLEKETRKATEIGIEGDFSGTFTYGEDFSLKNAKFYTVYDDKTKDYENDYIVKGYNSKLIGEQNITLEKAGLQFPLSVNVKNKICTNFEIIYEPVKTDLFINQNFEFDGFEAQAIYDDGSTETLSADDCVFKINGSTVSKNTKVENKFKGTQKVEVSRKNADGIDNGNLIDEFNINVSDKEISTLKIENYPSKEIYYIGDKIDLCGLKVSAVYSDENEEKSFVLSNDSYIITAFDSSSVGEKEVFVKLRNKTDVQTSFKVTVKEKTPVGLEITKYPKMTVGLNKDFDYSDIEIAMLYDNGDLEKTNEFSVDTSEFNSSKEGETKVFIIPKNSSFEKIELKVSVIAEENHIWRKAIFGQSANVDKEKTGDAGVTTDNYGTIEGNINVKAWNGTGKITGDHDGIVYYYTKVSTDKNFSVSADIKVNKYLEHDNDDTKRSGQEAFGIMARDVVPFKTPSDERTTNTNEAEKDSDGVEIPYEKPVVFASNVVIAGGYSGAGWPTDPTSENYEKNSKINRINLYARKGVTAPDEGGTKVGPYALSTEFPKEGTVYRVTLKRVSGGFYAECFDYQTETTKSSFLFEDELLTSQDSDNIYVGFFAARWADIDVSNVEFYETNPKTDPVYKDEKEVAITPSVNITSSEYSKDTNYNLDIATPSVSGVATIKQNGKIIFKDVPVNDGNISLNTQLLTDSLNKFSVHFTPDRITGLTSPDDIVINKSVLHRNFTTEEKVFVANDGTMFGDGSEEKPYDIDTAIGFLNAGQTIVLKGGIYSRTEPIVIGLGNDGTSDNMKSLTAKDNEEVIFDFNGVSAGVELTGNYWSVKNIQFRRSGDNLKCFHLGGSNCIIENCKFYDNGDIGFQISRTYTTDDFSKWPSNNIVLNCESYNNCDPSMINADGFGAKLTVGNGNVFKNCSSHHNVDDGWDLYTKVKSGAIGSVTLENCVSYKNGYKLLSDGTEEAYSSGGHNGFKLGGENVFVKHVMINCEAYENGANGVTTNSNPALKMTGVKSHDNEDCNFRIYSDKPAEYDYEFSDCTSYNGGNKDILATITEKTEYSNASPLPIISSNNYFITNDDGKSINADGAEYTANYIK